MNAFKCDICGKFFEKIKPVSGVEVDDIYNYSITKWSIPDLCNITLDLCDECQTKLALFIKGEDMHE